MFIVKPQNWVGKYFGPYSTEYGAEAAISRLMKHHNKAKHSSVNFKRRELQIVQVN